MHKALRIVFAYILGLAGLWRLDDIAKDDIIPKFSLEAKRLDELIREITILAQDVEGLD